jgi:hypothetical protein
VLINEDLQTTVADLSAILAAERRRTLRTREQIGEFVETLLHEP